jgi:hypothetical protein
MRSMKGSGEIKDSQCLNTFKTLNHFISHRLIFILGWVGKEQRTKCMGKSPIAYARFGEKFGSIIIRELSNGLG